MDYIIEEENKKAPKTSKKQAIEGFYEFWQKYPKKVAKHVAILKWCGLKLTEDEKKALMEALEKHKEQENWNKDNGAYIPHPATWLFQRRWEDELPEPPQIKSYG